jgi:hypothetical protein
LIAFARIGCEIGGRDARTARQRCRTKGEQKKGSDVISTKSSGERLLNRLFHKLGRRRKPQTAQVLDHWDSLLPGRYKVLAGVDRFEHRTG